MHFHSDIIIKWYRNFYRFFMIRNSRGQQNFISNQFGTYRYCRKHRIATSNRAKAGDNLPSSRILCPICNFSKHESTYNNNHRCFCLCAQEEKFRDIWEKMQQRRSRILICFAEFVHSISVIKKTRICRRHCCSSQWCDRINNVTLQ